MITSILFGSLLGIISGLLPGIGNASIMLVFLPLITQFDPINLFTFYLAILITSQYVASVTAIYTGIPGAESAIPVSKEFPNIRSYKLSKIAIEQNATGAFYGNMIGLSLFGLGFYLMEQFLFVYKNNIKITILILAYLVFIYISKNRLTSILMVALASFICSIGYNPHTYETFNLGIERLNTGIYWIPLILGALMGEAFYSLKHETKQQITIEEKDIQYDSNKVRSFYLNGGFFGFFIGLIPGISYILGSNLMYLINKRKLFKKNANKIDQTLLPIAASESAHSSGVLAALMPLLIIGIPITASEAVFFNLVTIDFSLNEIIEFFKQNYIHLAINLIVINIVGYYSALKGRHLATLMMKVDLNHLRYGLFVLGAIAVYFASDIDLVLDLITYFIIFYAFNRKYADSLTFVMAVLLYPHFINSLYLFKDLL